MSRGFQFLRLAGFIIAIAIAMAAFAASGQAQHGGGGHMGGGGWGGGGGWHRGGNTHGGCCFFGFGFGGYPYAPFYGPSYGYSPPYPYSAPPPAYPYPAYPTPYGTNATPYSAAPAVPHPGAALAGYEVYFDTNSTRLNADAQHVIAAAASLSAAHQEAIVAVAGFTDAAGDAAHNNELSRRRAESVRAALVGAGVRAEMIAVTWHGEEGLRVATGDGVAEPHNRRVVILVGAPPPPTT